jgi:hypothetical protein
MIDWPSEGNPMKWKHSILEIDPGPDSLKHALEEIDRAGKEVVSVVPNTGGKVTSLTGSGNVSSLLVIVKEPA